MQQKDSDGTLVESAVSELMNSGELWREYAAAIKDSEGLDMDFPDADERVTRAWQMNGKMLQAAQEVVPTMRSNFHLHEVINEALWRAAGGKI